MNGLFSESIHHTTDIATYTEDVGQCIDSRGTALAQRPALRALLHHIAVIVVIVIVLASALLLARVTVGYVRLDVLRRIGHGGVVTKVHAECEQVLGSVGQCAQQDIEQRGQMWLERVVAQLLVLADSGPELECFESNALVLVLRAEQHVLDDAVEARLHIRCVAPDQRGECLAHLETHLWERVRGKCENTL